jgi:iron complex transport system ATP-binding protein
VLANQIAFVAQEQQLPGHLRLTDMLSLAFLPALGWFGRLQAEDRERISRMLSVFGMSALADKPVGGMSTGERQRAALARALLQRPRLLLLDEPTNHLDPEAKHRFWETLLAGVREGGCDVIVSSHDLERVRRHARWICALADGQIVYSGPADGFWSRDVRARAFPALEELS